MISSPSLSAEVVAMTRTNRNMLGLYSTSNRRGSSSRFADCFTRRPASILLLHDWTPMGKVYQPIHKPAGEYIMGITGEAVVRRKRFSDGFTFNYSTVGPCIEGAASLRRILRQECNKAFQQVLDCLI